MAETINLSDYVSPQEAADMIGCTVKDVYGLIHYWGSVRGRKVGWSWLLLRQDVEGKTLEQLQRKPETVTA